MQPHDSTISRSKPGYSFVGAFETDSMMTYNSTLFRGSAPHHRFLWKSATPNTGGGMYLSFEDNDDTNFANMSEADQRRLAAHLLVQTIPELGLAELVETLQGLSTFYRLPPPPLPSQSQETRIHAVWGRSEPAPPFSPVTEE